MSHLCQGITLSGKQCNNRIKDKRFCYHHRKNSQSDEIMQYRQHKPPECIICRESLANQRYALECGHWIHKKCVIRSAKAECPICRSKLVLGKNDMARINAIAKKRREKYLLEEAEELRTNLQFQVAGLIAPELQERIQDIVGDLLDDAGDIDTIDILTDIFDDDTYQSLLHNLIGYESGS